MVLGDKEDNCDLCNETQSKCSDLFENTLNNYECGDYIFSSNFDSGNLRKVTLVKKYPGFNLPNKISIEFDAWTTPDCHGTPNESTNRTWFYFSIKGGLPFANAKINIKNLNRQSKLFSNGMQPVVKIGDTGKWERIQSEVQYCVENDNFSISFIHQPLKKNDIEHYYAFTYPFTYTECQQMLEIFDKKYERSLENICFKIDHLDALEKKSKKYQSTLDNNNGCEDKYFQTEDETLETKLLRYKNCKEKLSNKIYYHRELLINSLERRRIDLLTITSFHGIQSKQEERLQNLFPDSGCFRSHIFKNKKIIFLSSRVHPGETPASFVLNGLLKLILDEYNVVAKSLRQLYVFKIVPFLNPDGVFKGYYRTDTLGQNLNRMYINPNIDKQPSIYAVKKLIKFYDVGIQEIESTSFLANKSGKKILKEPKDVEDNQVTASKKRRKNIKRTGKKIQKSVLNNKPLNIQENEEVHVPVPQKPKKNLLESKIITQKKKKATTASLHKKLEKAKILFNSTNNYENKTISNVLSKKKDSDIKETNLFLYIDFHGHASKKGIFMYGNNFTKAPEAVECMLLPQIMSNNCHYFHYDACSFSRRNMYKREKQGGLSKEGSGRVAIFKMTGLIKCYTFESNYNCGNYINILPPQALNMIYVIKPSILPPPKYTPSIFEEVGRALALSILDINNYSPRRSHNLELKSIQKFRFILKDEIQKSHSFLVLSDEEEASTSNSQNKNNKVATDKTIKKSIPKGVKYQRTK